LFDELKSKIKILNFDNTDVKNNNSLDYSESKEELNINNNLMNDN